MAAAKLKSISPERGNFKTSPAATIVINEATNPPPAALLRSSADSVSPSTSTTLLTNEAAIDWKKAMIPITSPKISAAIRISCRLRVLVVRVVLVRIGVKSSMFPPSPVFGSKGSLPVKKDYFAKWYLMVKWKRYDSPLWHHSPGVRFRYDPTTGDFLPS